MKLAALALSFLLLIGCSGHLKEIAQKSDEIVAVADKYEKQLDSVCNAAIDGAMGDENFEDRLAAIQSKCLLAWAAYDDFRMAWIALNDAMRRAEEVTDAANVEAAMRALATMLKAFDEFRMAVENVVGSEGQEAN